MKTFVVLLVVLCISCDNPPAEEPLRLQVTDWHLTTLGNVSVGTVEIDGCEYIVAREWLRDGEAGGLGIGICHKGNCGNHK